MAKPSLISSAQAAKELGVSHRRVQQLITAGRLSAQKIGRNYVVERSGLAEVRERKIGRPPKRGAARGAKSR